MPQTTTLSAQQLGHLRWRLIHAPGRHSLSLYNGRVPFTIRDFRPSDFDTLWRIDQECFPAGISYSRRELKFYIERSGSFTIVAVSATESRAGELGSDRSIAGFLVAERGGRHVGHIITIDVVKEFRRLSVGSQLLESAEDRLRSLGCQAVGLETAVDNLSALSFYKNRGYSVVRTWPRYYSNGVDALLLRKDMAEAS
jgi:ribosomal-protein-alanine N-acetyltransferase